MKFTFNQAEITDAKQIAELMLFAMDKIVFDFIGDNNQDKAMSFLISLVEQEDNQYSYQNITVIKNDHNQIVGMFNIYDGALLNQLRKPVLKILKDNYNQIITPQDETEAGEYYIDTIAIYPKYRGLGIGQLILDYIILEYAEKQNKTIGLLVDFTNPKAKKLYTNKGFIKVGEKQLMNENHEHLQYKKGSY